VYLLKRKTIFIRGHLQLLHLNVDIGTWNDKLYDLQLLRKFNGRNLHVVSKVPHNKTAYFNSSRLHAAVGELTCLIWQAFDIIQ
jgi:hypothetical protein